MPTLLERQFVSHKVAKVLETVTPGCEWVLAGEGVATEKVDGACCAIIDGVLYRRYDANLKKGRKPPVDGIPCQEAADPVTGHWPFWVRVLDGVASDKHFARAFSNTPWCREDGTYEAVGVHFQGNPYGLDDDFLEKHGRIKLLDCPRDYGGIYDYLATHEIEGIVWHRGNGDMCKIKRSDFGLEWPAKRGEFGGD